MSKKYKAFNFRGNYLDYARERDEHLYHLWKRKDDRLDSRLH